MKSKSGDPILDSDLEPSKKIMHIMLKDLNSDKIIDLVLKAKKDGKSERVVNLFKAYLMHALDKELEAAGLVKS